MFYFPKIQLQFCITSIARKHEIQIKQQHRLLLELQHIPALGMQIIDSTFPYVGHSVRHTRDGDKYTDCK